jgi:glycosyltransferase involved in cell wall biosynthesis
MEPYPLVSIIINNCNYGRYLAQAIDSALAQSYERVELIVVDDGSTDNSASVIGGYGGHIVPVFKENGGQGSAMNAGLACSRGQVVIFLDSDDLLMPQAAEAAVRAFAEHRGAAKVEYRMAVIDDAGRPTGEIRPPCDEQIDSGDLRRKVLAFPFDLKWMATSGNAFSASVLHRIFPVPEHDYRILADFYLSHIAALFGPVVALDQVLACYRFHGANNYEAAGRVAPGSLDLAKVRESAKHMRATNLHIIKFARRLGLSTHRAPKDDILSVSYIANRLISSKLDLSREWPRVHTISVLALLVWYGLVASVRRFDVSWTRRLVFAVWFLAVAAAPAPGAHWLAHRFFYQPSAVSRQPSVDVGACGASEKLIADG